MWAACRIVIAASMLAFCLVGLIGCQTTGTSAAPVTAGGVLFGRSERPDVKPGKQPEVLTVAPSEARFNQSVYPAVAFRDMNSEYKKPLTAGGSSLIQSTPNNFNGLTTPTNFANSTSGGPLGR